MAAKKDIRNQGGGPRKGGSYVRDSKDAPAALKERTGPAPKTTVPQQPAANKKGD